MTDAQKLTAIQMLIDTDGRFMTDGEVVDGVVDILEEERDIDAGIDEPLKQVFLDDCTETHGLSDNEALDLWHDKGEEFVDYQIDKMWHNWSMHFPNVEGE